MSVSLDDDIRRNNISWRPEVAGLTENDAPEIFLQAIQEAALLADKIIRARNSEITFVSHTETLE